MLNNGPVFHVGCCELHLNSIAIAVVSWVTGRAACCDRPRLRPLALSDVGATPSLQLPCLGNSRGCIDASRHFRQVLQIRRRLNLQMRRKWCSQAMTLIRRLLDATRRRRAGNRTWVRGTDTRPHRPAVPHEHERPRKGPGSGSAQGSRPQPVHRNVLAQTSAPTARGARSARRRPRFVQSLAPAPQGRLAVLSCR